MFHPNNQTNNISRLSKEWATVLKYYLSLPDDYQKNQYLHTMSSEQRKYLLGLLSQSYNKGMSTNQNNSQQSTSYHGNTTAVDPNPANNKSDRLTDFSFTQKKHIDHNAQAYPAYSQKEDVFSQSPGQSFGEIDKQQKFTSFFEDRQGDSRQSVYIKPKNKVANLKKKIGEKIGFFANKKMDSHTISKDDYMKIKNKNQVLKYGKYAGLGVAILITSLFVFNPSLRFQLISYLPFVNKGIETRANLDNKDNDERYKKWVSSFINEADKRDPDLDYNKDGLSNYEEFLLGLDPTNSDINGNGKLNGLDLLESIDPMNGKFLSSSDRDNIEKLVDRERVVYRLQSYTLNQNINPEDQEEYTSLPDLTVRNIDPEHKGLVNIEAIDIKDLEVLWQFNEDSLNFRENILVSLIHYDKTNLPAVGGNAYVFGSMEKLSNLNQVQPNDEIVLRVKTEEETEKKLVYVVTGKNIFDPIDFSQFESRKYSELSLAAPLELNTSMKVLVVKAKLVSVEDLQVEPEAQGNPKQETEIVEEETEEILE
jgi:hypothetical protein